LKKFTDAVLGEAEIEGPRCALERTPLPETRRGPRIGEHTTEILETICNLSKNEIAQLADAGVLA
jgi:crotonobetainyl-CoA:carnitine CoA-transferase CaiB-like acyl-CoA transferase